MEQDLGTFFGSPGTNSVRLTQIGDDHVAIDVLGGQQSVITRVTANRWMAGMIRDVLSLFLSGKRAKSVQAREPRAHISFSEYDALERCVQLAQKVYAASGAVTIGEPTIRFANSALDILRQSLPQQEKMTG